MRDGSPSVRLLARYLMGCATWWVLIYVVFVATNYLPGVLLSPAGHFLRNPPPAVASQLIGFIAFVATAGTGGWIGGTIATRLHLDAPTWWAPSVSAMVFIVVNMTVRAWPDIPPQVWVAEAMVYFPVLIGQALAVRASRKRGSAGSPPAVASV